MPSAMPRNGGPNKAGRRQSKIAHRLDEMDVTIFCDELSDELLASAYLCNGSLTQARVERLPSLARAPEVLKPLLRWERHDWVVVRDGVITCTVEFSRHGYTGDNSFQRFARLFRAASLGAPTIYFTPF